MEEVTEGINNINMIGGDLHKKNRIQRYMQQHNEVELSALGLVISTVASVAEILKNNGFSIEKKITTSTVELSDDLRGRPISKAKIEIVLRKTENFEELLAEREAADVEE